MGFLEWVDATKLVIGVILTAFGAVSGIILWVNKRMKAVADNAIREAGAPHQQTVHRLGKLEAEVIDMGQDVGSVQAELSHRCISSAHGFHWPSDRRVDASGSQRQQKELKGSL